MSQQYPDYVSPRCSDINRQVRLAERHQQELYRDQQVHPLKNDGPSIWARAWKLAQSAFTTARPSVRTGSPALH